uniref:Laminin-G n=1 Tax=Adineta vaga TaxID=104782 RepID=B3VZZ6_ADIVA|nr:laminin-G [Adineta vaga]
MHSIIVWIVFLIALCFVLIQGKTSIPDQLPLVTIPYAQRNITIYTSSSNPSREPKDWLFWYDPLVVFDPAKDIHHYNEQVRFQFAIASSEFEQTARKTIITKMHPDVERSAVFWIIEPLPIDTLTIYLVDQAFLPIPAVYPCTKYHLSGISTFECQFVCTSMIIASSLTQNLLCGKIKFQLEYYIQSQINQISVPPRTATLFNLRSLRTQFRIGKYIHPRQESQLVAQYFIQTQTIDDTIKESELQGLFQLATNTTTRYDITYPNDIWSLNDLETIINQELFYISIQKNNKRSFHLKSTESSWAFKSPDKQTFNMDEIQAMFLEQHQLNVEWSSTESLWKIKSLTVRLLSDILDTLQLSVISKQYDIDKINATNHRSIDCSDWSSTCSCQAASSCMVFVSSTQFIRIPYIDMDFSKTGFTIELWIRPHALPDGDIPVQLINFRGEYQITYKPKGEITFSITNKRHPNFYTTTLQAIPLDQWTHITCVFVSIENQLRLYVNGEFVSSIILSIKSQKLNDDIIIGQQFIGAIRDVRLWGCSNPPEKILLSMRTSTLLGNETCLVGLWPMGDALGQTILDLSVNDISHPGTLGTDDNINLLNDPIWAYVLPKPPPPPPLRVLTYQIFRENITLPMVVQWGTIFDIPVPADYDGDGYADFAVYRRTTMTWLVSSSNDPTVLITKFWGIPGDIPVRCNFDGDRYFDFTVFRPSTAQWISHLSSNPGFQYIHKWGKPDDRPCPGDFDGDGKTDFVVYRRGAYYINPSSDPTVQWTKQWGQPDDICVSNCDFDGDGVTDFTVWTPNTAIWSWIPSKRPWLIYQKQWGSRYDIPLCGDFDGDGKRDFAVYREWTGEWFVISYRVSSFIITFRWGRPTDIPVMGDYDGDGFADFAHWRPRANKTWVWEVIPSLMPVTKLRKAWGIAGDQPVVGDFDGDKRTDFTVYRTSNGFWYILFIGKPGIQMIKHWGFTVNDSALAGDWDGDFLTDFTIYRPSTGYWYIMLQKNPILQIFMQWGVPLYKDIGVPGDFDGDLKYDFAVWRPSNGVWYILPSTNPAHVVIAQWGLPDDIPVAAVDADGDGKADLTVYRPSTGSWYILPSTNPVYPYFGPHIIQQPILSLPPIAGGPPAVPLPPVPRAPGPPLPSSFVLEAPPAPDAPAATPAPQET